MPPMQNFTLLLLHKDPKSKTRARDVDGPPGTCVLLVTMHKLPVHVADSRLACPRSASYTAKKTAV